MGIQLDTRLQPKIIRDFEESARMVTFSSYCLCIGLLLVSAITVDSLPQNAPSGAPPPPPPPPPTPPPPPKFTATNQTINVVEGDPLEFSCKAYNYQLFYTLIWSKLDSAGAETQLANDNLILAKDKRISVDHKLFRSIMTINNIGPDDAGVYKCSFAMQNSPEIYISVGVIDKPEDEQDPFEYSYDLDTLFGEEEEASAPQPETTTTTTEDPFEDSYDLDTLFGSK